MPNIRGLITEIGKRTVAFDSCQRWESLGSSWVPAEHCTRVKLSFDENLKDKLIELSSGPCELTVENGKIIDIMKLAPEEIDISRLTDILGQREKTLNPARRALGIIKALESQHGGMVTKDTVLERLQKDLGLDLRKAEGLVVGLEKEGHIYQPRAGFFKTTD
jgi:hypothetical protein